MKKRQQELQLKREEKSKLFTLLTFFTVVILALSQVVLSNHLAILGEKIKTHQDQIDKLTLENTQLEGELSRSWSLVTLSEEAQKIGLVKANSIIYLAPQIPVALK